MLTYTRRAQIIAAMSDTAFDGAADLDKRFAWMEEMGGADFVAEIVDLFRTSVPETLAGAEAARDNADLEALAAAVHSMKSSAGNIGAVALEEVCRRCEEAARSGDAATANALVADVNSGLAAVMQELERRFPQ